MTELERLQLKEARERESGRRMRRVIGLLGFAVFFLALGSQQPDPSLGVIAAVVCLLVAVRASRTD